MILRCEIISPCRDRSYVRAAVAAIAITVSCLVTCAAVMEHCHHDDRRERVLDYYETVVAHLAEVGP